MAESALPCRAATFVGVYRMAHAPVRIQEVMSKNVLVFFAGVGHAPEAPGNLLVLDELRTAGPRRM